MATVTSPIILDSTGQDIVTKLNAISTNLNKTASDIPYDVNSTIKGKIDDTNTRIDNIKFGTVASITAGNNETIADAIDRLRDTYFDDSTPFRQIKMTIDGTSDMIFNCKRWSGKNTSIWEATKPTSDSSMTTILFSMNSSSVAVRKYVTSSSGVTGTNISTDLASGDLIIQGSMGANF